MADTALIAIAAELYAGSPSEFVSRRDAQAKAADDSSLAAGVKALKKPSVAAWVVNLFAREQATQLAQALGLAEDLRAAQADLDAATLARLGRERRALTRHLAQSAADLAGSRGERVTSTTLDAVERTISAAFFSPEAAAAVASGRLIRELDASEAVDLKSAVGGGTPDAPAPVIPPADEVAARRNRRTAERALLEAERARDRAYQEQKQAEQAHRSASTRRDQQETRIEELTTELARATKDAENARGEVGSAADRVAAATSRLVAADTAAASAREALDALNVSPPRDSDR